MRLWGIKVVLVSCAFGVLEGAALAQKELSREECVTTLSQKMQQRPRATSSEVLKALQKLAADDDSLVFEQVPPELKSEIQSYFDSDTTLSSRLEHLYTLLYLVGRFAKDQNSEISFSTKSMQNLIRSSRVFPSREFEDSIRGSRMKWNNNTSRSQWTMEFGVPELVLELNDGLGFKGYEHGFCQHVKRLIVYNSFEFSLERNPKGNIRVRFHRPIDFAGDFGSRGKVIDVNLEFITLREMEFLRGSKQGVVTAVIAQREFDKGNHSWLFRMLAKMITRESTQPIDW